MGSTPAPTDNGQAVVAWFDRHGDHVRVWLWLLTLSLPLFATLASIVRTHLPSPHRDVFLLGAAAFAVETAVQGWLWAGLSWHPHELGAAGARLLLDVASYWGAVLTGATVTMLAPVALAALGPDRAVPRWVGVVASVALAEQLVETATVFGRVGFMALGGAMNLYLGAGLVGLALPATGLAVARALRNQPLPA